MTTSRMTACVLLLAVCVLAGCGGSQTTASNPTPSPSPTTPPSTPPPPGTPLPPSFPTEFVYTADASTITSFKINSDGSLSAPVTAATVALPEIVKGLGTSLITNSGLFAVNPATGALQLQDSQPFFFTDAVTDIFPDPSGVTFHGNSSLALHFPPLNSFSIATGHVALVQQITGGQGWFQMLASDPEGKFVYTANQPGGNLVGFNTLLAVLPRNADGTVVGTPVQASARPMCSQGVSSISGAALTVKGTHTVLYHICAFPDELGYTTIDNTTGMIINSANLSIPGGPFPLHASETVAVDPSSTSLLVVNSAAKTVDVYALDQNGVPGAQPVSRTSPGMAPLNVHVDATGQYVYVLATSCATNASNPRPGCSDNGQVFGYKLSGGNLSLLPGAPYKAGPSSTSMTIMKF